MTQGPTPVPVQTPAPAPAAQLTAWEHASLIVGAAAALGLAVADLWHFHALAGPVDGAVIAGALSALGVKGIGILPS